MADEIENTNSESDPFHPAKAVRQPSPAMVELNERNIVLQEQLEERAAREAEAKAKVKADEREAGDRVKRQVKTKQEENPPIMELLRHSMQLDHRRGAEAAGEVDGPALERGPAPQPVPHGFEPNPGKTVKWEPGQ